MCFYLKGIIKFFSLSNNKRKRFRYIFMLFYIFDYKENILNVFKVKK